MGRDEAISSVLRSATARASICSWAAATSGRRQPCGLARSACAQVRRCSHPLGFRRQRMGDRRRGLSRSSRKAVRIASPRLASRAVSSTEARRSAIELSACASRSARPSRPVLSASISRCTARPRPLDLAPGGGVRLDQPGRDLQQILAGELRFLRAPGEQGDGNQVSAREGDREGEPGEPRASRAPAGRRGRDSSATNAAALPSQKALTTAAGQWALCPDGVQGGAAPARPYCRRNPAAAGGAGCDGMHRCNVFIPSSDSGFDRSWRCRRFRFEPMLTRLGEGAGNEAARSRSRNPMWASMAAMETGGPGAPTAAQRNYSARAQPAPAASCRSSTRRPGDRHAHHPRLSGAGLGDAWFANPIKPDFLVCRLTEEGCRTLTGGSAAGHLSEMRHNVVNCASDRRIKRRAGRHLTMSAEAHAPSTSIISTPRPAIRI